MQLTGRPFKVAIATLNKGRGSNIKYKPLAFTEEGVAMLSSVLRSKVAINDLSEDGRQAERSCK